MVSTVVTLQRVRFCGANMLSEFDVQIFWVKIWVSRTNFLDRVSFGVSDGFLAASIKVVVCRAFIFPPIKLPLEMAIADISNIFTTKIAHDASTRASQLVAAAFLDDLDLTLRALLEESGCARFLQDVPLADPILSLPFIAAHGYM
jgi:hypothetical protein